MNQANRLHCPLNAVEVNVLLAAFLASAATTSRPLSANASYISEALVQVAEQSQPATMDELANLFHILPGAIINMPNVTPDEYIEYQAPGGNSSGFAKITIRHNPIAGRPLWEQIDIDTGETICITAADVAAKASVPEKRYEEMTTIHYPNGLGLESTDTALFRFRPGEKGETDLRLTASGCSPAVHLHKIF